MHNAIALNPDKYLAMIVHDRDLSILRQDYRFIELAQNKDKLIIQST
ncbi:MAG: hypothetical protein QNJ41_11245 [Xenococcaceae cyanobacterium MO_188.B32]|nr:hypothetical protein [Xenococcaceae cyanobacterium MO_188.B32]